MNILAYVLVKHVAGELEVRLFFGSRDIAEDALLSDVLEILNEKAIANPYEFDKYEVANTMAEAYGKHGFKVNPDFDESREVVTFWLRDFALEIESHVDISVGGG